MCGNMGGGGSGNGNSKYNGFSITQDGVTKNYIVMNGGVHFADGSQDKDMFGNDQVEMIQRVYDLEGNVDSVIKRINRIGIAQAKTLPDKEVERMQAERTADRKATQDQQAQDAYKRKGGVNRHRLYWSAM